MSFDKYIDFDEDTSLAAYLPPRVTVKNTLLTGNYGSMPTAFTWHTSDFAFRTEKKDDNCVVTLWNIHTKLKVEQEGQKLFLAIPMNTRPHQHINALLEKMLTIWAGQWIDEATSHMAFRQNED